MSTPAQRRRLRELEQDARAQPAPALVLIDGDEWNALSPEDRRRRTLEAGERQVVIIQIFGSDQEM